MKILANFIVLIFFFQIPYSHSGVPNRESHKHTAAVATSEGLYDKTDKVISLTGDNLRDHVLEKSYATLLEFYNSYCGHCRRFAPSYKKIAIDMWPWRDLLKVMAIDCAADENNDICRKYEVMAYPSLRYFPPHYKDDEKNLGISINGQQPDFIKTFVIKSLINESLITDHQNNNNNINNSRTPEEITLIQPTWPNFSALNTINHINDIFRDLSTDIQLIFIIFESENSTLASRLMLDFYRIKSIQIRRVTQPTIAKKFNIETFNTISVVDRNLNIDTISVANAGEENFEKIIKDYLKKKNIHYEIIDDATGGNDAGADTTDDDVLKSAASANRKAISDHKLSKDEILNEVKSNKHLVYQSDLEHALRYSLFHEITKFTEINGEKLLALQRYINVLVRYNPLGSNGQKFLQKLREFILTHNQEINGELIQNELLILEKEFSPIFSSSQWIGCQPSKSGLRGFTCGLWQLFHFMTVQAAENEKSTDPLEVLQAMHGYVKYFFGCSDCSSHFQAMAAKNKIWNTSSKDNAILWLWSAHNEVNRRLMGDQTEDPEFPKLQFPTRDSCTKCYKEQSTSPVLISVDNLNDINWDRTEVLLFLKNIHSPLNISRFGIDDDSVLPPTAEKLREKRSLGNVFSDVDMRVGICLYIFCIGMMVIAVKLFLRKGYRKKVYSYDFLGKV